jgi:hypothetical protein
MSPILFWIRISAESYSREAGSLLIANSSRAGCLANDVTHNVLISLFNRRLS